MKRLVLISVALGLAGCGGTAASSSTTSPPPTAAAVTTTTVNTAAVGQQVLAIIKAGNAKVQLDKTNPDNTAALTALSGDFSSTAQQLQALTYPADAQTDAKAIVASLEKLSYDATTLATAGAATAEADGQTMTSDEGSEVAASDALRHDLGLPPATT